MLLSYWAAFHLLLLLDVLYFGSSHISAIVQYIDKYRFNITTILARPDGSFASQFAQDMLPRSYPAPLVLGFGNW